MCVYVLHIIVYYDLTGRRAKLPKNLQKQIKTMVSIPPGRASQLVFVKGDQAGAWRALDEDLSGCAVECFTGLQGGFGEWECCLVPSRNRRYQ